MVPCPNESTIQAFVAGELRAADCAGIEAHIDTCAECRRLLAEVGRALAVSAPPVVTSRATEDTPATLEVLGSQVGRYTLLEAIGAGAMGVVYAARDPDLDRKIAIKLVRGGGVGSGDASARMQREAKAIAKLSHPHVVAIYDVGTFRGDVFIAMELADGGTLRDVLARHAVPWRDVLGYYLQAGRGLAAAHEVGIVHRDFKPDNVLFGKDGRVRVGDFGLALDAGSEDRRDVSARVRSLEATATQTGTVLGTPAYMAPEQMRGERTDARADVFAFSVSVWEGLYGARPFEGASFAELRANVEAGQVRAAPAGTGVPEALRTCLLKGISAHAEERWGSMSELLAALEAAPVPPRRRSRRALALGAFAAIVVMGASGVAATRALQGSRAVAAATSAPASDPVAAHFDPKGVRRLTFGHACEEYPSFSPDGAQIVYDGAVGKDTQLFMSDVLGGAPRQLTRDPGWHWAAAVSPDGRSVGYLYQHGADTGTYVMPLDGSAPPHRVGDMGVDPSWSWDGSCLWAGYGSARCVDPASGAALGDAITPPAGFRVKVVQAVDSERTVVALLEVASRRMRGVVVYTRGEGEPRWLTRERVEEVLLLTPDHSSVIVAQIADTSHPSALAILPLDGSAERLVPRTDIQPSKGMSYAAAADRVVWSTCVNDPELVALKPVGTGQLRAEPIFPATDWQDTEPAWLHGTMRMVVNSNRTGRRSLWIVDRQGVELPRELPLDGMQASNPAVSPSGDVVAFTSADGGIYVVPADGSAPARRLTEGDDHFPTIGRDGNTLYFERVEGVTHRVYMIPLSGGDAKPLLPKDTAAPDASIRDDVLAYIDRSGGRASARPMLLDLRTGRSRILSGDLPPGTYPRVRLSPVAPRAAVLGGETLISEVDLASATVTRRFDAGSDQLASFTYFADEIVASRRVWRGDLWTGTAPFR